MQSLAWIAFICWALAAVAVAVAIGTESPFFIIPAVSLAISGVLFAAFERIIALLTEIRDALAGPELVSEPASPTTPAEERSIEEVTADLNRLKAGLKPLD